MIRFIHQFSTLDRADDALMLARQEGADIREVLRTPISLELEATPAGRFLYLARYLELCEAAGDPTELFTLPEARPMVWYDMEVE